MLEHHVFTYNAATLFTYSKKNAKHTHTITHTAWTGLQTLHVASSHQSKLHGLYLHNASKIATLPKKNHSDWLELFVVCNVVSFQQTLKTLQFLTHF